MAAGRIAEPGSDFGPCADACTHTDCAFYRKMAKMECYICHKPIGYGKRFYQKDNWTNLSHAVCEEELTEKKLEADKLASR